MSFPLNMRMVLNIVTLKKEVYHVVCVYIAMINLFKVESSALNYYINVVWHEVCLLVLLQGMDWYSGLGCSENKYYGFCVLVITTTKS
jgi:hypothetical protein